MDIHQSIDEVLDSEEILGQTFYEIFLAKHPDVPQHFVNVNVGRQAARLAMALLLVEQYDTYRYPAIAKYLRELGEFHRERQIPVELFPLFREALLEALARHHGPQWNEDLGRQWEQAFERAVRVMLEAYPDTPANPINLAP